MTTRNMRYGANSLLITIRNWHNIMCMLQKVLRVIILRGSEKTYLKSCR